MPVLDALGCAEYKRAGSWYEPDSSSTSEAANDRLSSISPSSLSSNETRSLAAAEGCWSRRVKRTGENCTAGVSSLISERWNPLPCCFFLAGPWEGLSAACRGALQEWQKRRGICNNAKEISSFRGVLWRESCWITAGNPWTSYCRLLRSGESAEQSEVWISCDGSFNSEGFESCREEIWGALVNAHII